MREDRQIRLRGLYAITPDEADTDRLLARVAAVLASKPALLQYRNKAASHSLRESQASQLLTLCREARVPLVINDDAQLAAAIGADGVHFGAHDGDLATARKLLGVDAIIGVSCYADVAFAERAADGNASYVAFGSVFASPTKPQAARADVKLLFDARRRLQLPICAIGGITRANAAPLVRAGIDLLAVITDVFETAEPQAAALAFAALFAEPNNHSAIVTR